MTDLFSRFDPADVRDLVAEYPLAWVVARGTGEASLLPLLGEHDGEGRLVTLIGHLGRRDPLQARLADRPAGTILFTGPQAHVSPDHTTRLDWGTDLVLRAAGDHRRRDVRARALG